MYSLLKTVEFDRWLAKLRDQKAKARIVSRMVSAEKGNLGDVSPVGSGVSEMRVHYGPGYRVYFTLRGKELIVLLIGGDKSSQKKDIEKAKTIAKEIEEGEISINEKANKVRRSGLSGQRRGDR